MQVAPMPPGHGAIQVGFNGGSVLLGGLISTTTEETRGIPLLKDIPSLGQLFRTDARSNSKSMVVMLIVPYIIEDQEEAAITEALERRLNIRIAEPVERKNNRQDRKISGKDS